MWTMRCDDEGRLADWTVCGRCGAITRADLPDMGRMWAMRCDNEAGRDESALHLGDAVR
jgi:hypothetical protein